MCEILSVVGGLASDRLRPKLSSILPLSLSLFASSQLPLPPDAHSHYVFRFVREKTRRRHSADTQIQCVLQAFRISNSTRDHGAGRLRRVAVFDPFSSSSVADTRMEVVAHFGRVVCMRSHINRGHQTTRKSRVSVERLCGFVIKRQRFFVLA